MLLSPLGAGLGHTLSPSASAALWPGVGGLGTHDEHGVLCLLWGTRGGERSRLWLLEALSQGCLGCEGGCPADLPFLCGRAALRNCLLGLPSICVGFGVVVRSFLLRFQNHLHEKGVILKNLFECFSDIQITVPYIGLMITVNRALVF